MARQQRVVSEPSQLHHARIMSDDLELFQFRYSHFNEKVRWALDHKALSHRRTDLLPGPHASTIKKMTGQTQTPVLRINDQYVHDSAWIIERLELIFTAAPSLLPPDDQTRDRAREIARHFDFVVGPAARICAFVAMLGKGRDARDAQECFVAFQALVAGRVEVLLEGRVGQGHGSMVAGG